MLGVAAGCGSDAGGLEDGRHLGYVKSVDASSSDVVHVREVVVSFADPGGPTEVVDRGVTMFREAESELFVEAVQATHVG